MNQILRVFYFKQKNENIFINVVICVDYGILHIQYLRNIDGGLELLGLGLNKICKFKD